MTKFKGLMCGVLLAASAVFSQTPDPARRRAADYSDVRYKLNITLEKGAAVIKGTIEIDLTLKTESKKLNPDEAQIVLDWRKFKGREDLSTVSNIYINGRCAALSPNRKITSASPAAEYEEIDGHLVFKEGVVAGENLIRLDFTSPVAESGAGVTRYTDKEDGTEYVYSQFGKSNASTAFPLFEHPDLKARFQLNVNIGGGRQRPAWKVISNMEPEWTLSSTWNNFYVFKETEPLAIGDFAFAAGDFAVFTDQANNGLVKTAPPGSTRIYEPMRDPNPAKIYVRKSQAEKFKAHAAEIFRLFRADDRETKNEIVLLPDSAGAPRVAAGLRFVGESDVFRDYR